MRPNFAARRKAEGESNMRSGAVKHMWRMITREAALVERLEAEAPWGNGSTR